MFCCYCRCRWYWRNPISLSLCLYITLSPNSILFIISVAIFSLSLSLRSQSHRRIACTFPCPLHIFRLSKIRHRHRNSMCKRILHIPSNKFYLYAAHIRHTKWFVRSYVQCIRVVVYVLLSLQNTINNEEEEKINKYGLFLPEYGKSEGRNGWDRGCDGNGGGDDDNVIYVWSTHTHPHIFIESSICYYCYDGGAAELAVCGGKRQPYHKPNPHPSILVWETGENFNAFTFLSYTHTQPAAAEAAAVARRKFVFVYFRFFPQRSFAFPTNTLTNTHIRAPASVGTRKLVVWMCANVFAQVNWNEFFFSLLLACVCGFLCMRANGNGIGWWTSDGGDFHRTSIEMRQLVRLGRMMLGGRSGRHLRPVQK